LLEFSDFPGSPNLISRALKNAVRNWNWWEDDFLHCGGFAHLPVLSTYPRFRGFGADYSVFRGMTAIQCDELRTWLIRQTDPEQISELMSGAEIFFSGQIRISLISKLLTMWRPRRFVMWDQLARNGLAEAHGRNRGHCYTSQSVKAYELFRNDFFDLLDVWEDNLHDMAADIPDNIDIELFSPRLLDSLLMEIGK
jgi:hypothetical protein